MRVRDGDIKLDATFSVAETEDGQILTVESRGGTEARPTPGIWIMTAASRCC